MAKRAAHDDEAPKALKSGERPQRNGVGDQQGSEDEFEDEFEDEYESEEELFEAGIDGRPDKEREAEEQGMWTTPVALWGLRWASWAKQC